MTTAQLRSEMNRLGTAGTPFLAITDFAGNRCQIWPIDQIPEEIQFRFPSLYKEHKHHSLAKTPLQFHSDPVPFETYEQAFQNVAEHVHRGDTYLVNLTMPTPITINRTPEQIYHSVNARYKLLVPNKFLFFSPEPFVTIRDNRISSFPMKGTISAEIPDAESIILNDPKETAEHTTIVDLIRNDLSIMAKRVSVPRFRYIEPITTHRGTLLQVSSEISGELELNWQSRIGDIITSLLPAGSISGAPKPATVKVIRQSEPDDRGYYTGITVLFDGKSLESCVNIRFIELNDSGMIYRSGGGVTAKSDCRSEYEELIAKVYVPVIDSSSQRNDFRPEDDPISAHGESVGEQRENNHKP